MKEQSNTRGPLVLTIILGLAYGVLGFIEMIVGVGLLQPVLGARDLISGFALFIISLVFFAGVKPLARDEEEGFAFIVVGVILAAVVFILQLVLMGTHLLGWILQLEEWVEWNIITDVTPSLWMFLIVVTILGILKVSGAWRIWEERITPERFT